MSIAPPEKDIANRADWIMCLLHAPDRYDRVNRPLYGRTRLMKAAFLLHRNLEDNLDRETGFNFQPDKYGPFDKGVYDAVTFLENQSYLVKTEPEDHSANYEMVKYQLTEKGGKEAKRMFESLSEAERELVKWVKNKHALKKLGRLLTYVYDEYPEMTVNSELV